MKKMPWKDIKLLDIIELIRRIYMNNKIKYIDIVLDNMDDASSKFNNNILDEELENYIYKESINTQSKNIIIRIKTLFDINDKEKNTLDKMIRESFKLNINENLVHMKYANVKRSILMIIGTISVLVSELIDFSGIFLIPEIFLIIGWVGIWEAVYSLLFEDTKMKIENKRYKKIYKSKIEFIN